MVSEELDKVLAAATYFGKEACANGQVHPIRKDLALDLGFENWSAIPVDLRPQILKAWHKGWSVERNHQIEKRV